MKGRTYRYFSGEPLYPFGHGLSYTRFEYSELQIRQGRRSATPRPSTVSLPVRNVGARDGDEVVQLYVRDVESPAADADLKQLRGFERVSLARAEERRVALPADARQGPRPLRRRKKASVVEPGEFEIQVGASSRDIRATRRVRVNR